MSDEGRSSSSLCLWRRDPFRAGSLMVGEDTRSRLRSNEPKWVESAQTCRAISSRASLTTGDRPLRSARRVLVRWEIAWENLKYRIDAARLIRGAGKSL